MQDGTTFRNNTVVYEKEDGTEEIISNDIHVAQGADITITLSPDVDEDKKIVSILGGISSSQNVESLLNITNGATLKLSGKNDLFNGETFVKDESVLKFTKTEGFGSFVRGAVNIEEGSLVEFHNELTGADNTGLVTNLAGEGEFKKTGVGKVVIGDDADNPNVRFKGNINLDGGELTINAAPQANEGQPDFTANIGKGTTFNYNNGSWSKGVRDDSFTLDRYSKFKFDEEGSGANLNFLGHGTFTITEDIENAAGNNINLYLTTTSFDSNEYNANYTVNSSTITLKDNKITDVVFNNGFSTNSTLNMEFDFTDQGLIDTITASNGGSGTLSVGEITALNPKNDLGQLAGAPHIYKVLDGLTFNSLNAGTKTIDSDVYKYTVQTTDDKTGLILTANGLNPDTLYLLNHERKGDRHFYLLGTKYV